MPTQKDIAEELGVSVSLVSRALSGTARDIGVREATIRRVRATADAMGYVPNATARILRGARAMTIGVVVYDFEDPFFGPIIGALQRRAQPEGFSLLLAGFQQRRASALDLRPLLKHPLDGLVVVGSDGMGDWTAPFLEGGVPVVRIGTGAVPAPVSTVCVDEETGMQRALKHLGELGHRLVGFVGGPHETHRRRFQLFRDLLAAHGQETRRSWCCLSRADLNQAGFETTARLLQGTGGTRPTALVASSDVVAFGALRALSEAGLLVPGDVSVIGFDDLPMAAMTIPPLTTVRQPFTELARAAFECIAGAPAASESTVRLSPRLVVRASTGPAPRA